MTSRPWMGERLSNPQPRLESFNSLFGQPYALDDCAPVYGGADSLYYTENPGSTIQDPESVSELGRTYHGYKDGKYLLPNDAVEQDRMDLCHGAWSQWLGGCLHLAPIADVKNVLDLGTGTGIWALEFAELYPNANITGTDLSRIQPSGVRANVKWVQEDAEDDWRGFTQPFDFIHMRGMFTCFDDPKAVMRRAYEHLSPGGWIEYQDGSVNPYCQDTSSLGTSVHRWAFMLKEGGRRLGRDFDVQGRYKDWLREIGFVDIEEVIMQIPANTWPDDLRQKNNGSWALAVQLQGLEAISLRVLHHGLGMSVRDIELLVAQAKQDINNKKHRFSWTFHVVYARKPFR